MIYFSIGWYFWCDCSRCADSSECGTHMSSYMCDGLTTREKQAHSHVVSGGNGSEDGPCDGIVMAVQPTNMETDYMCHTCNKKFSSSLVSGLNMELEEMLEMTDKYEATGLEFLLQVIGKERKCRYYI